MRNGNAYVLLATTNIMSKNILDGFLANSQESKILRRIPTIMCIKVLFVKEYNN